MTLLQRVCVFQCVLGFPPGQRRDGGVGVAARVAALRVGGESRLFPLLLLAVRVVHRQSDERGRLPVGDVREINAAVGVRLMLVSRQRAPRVSSPVSALCDESPAGLHLDVQASLHRTHLHVLVQVAVHVALGCSQFQLKTTHPLTLMSVLGMQEELL